MSEHQQPPRLRTRIGRRIARSLLNLLLLGIVLASIGLALEYAGRKMAARKERSYITSPHLVWTDAHEYDPALMWRMKPNLHELEQGFDFAGGMIHWKTNTDAFGLRQGGAPADGTRERILALGDSRTYGLGVADAETWPARLQELLDRRFQGKYEVMNAGVTGYTIAQGLRYLETRGLALQPKRVIFCFGCNEAAPVPPPGIADCDWEDPTARLGIVTLVKDALRGAGLDSTRRTMPRTTRLTASEYLECMQRMKQVCDRNGIQLTCLVLPNFKELMGERTGHPNLTQLTMDTAKFCEMDVVNATPQLLKAAEPVFLDDVHLTATGNAIAAQAIDAAIAGTAGAGPGDQQRTEDQLAMLFSLAPLNPNFPLLYERLQTLLAREEPARQVERWKAVADTFPENVKVRYYCALALKASGNPGEAADHLHAVLERARKDTWLELEAGKVLLELGDPEGARNGLYAAMASNPWMCYGDAIVALTKGLMDKGIPFQTLIADMSGDKGAGEPVELLNRLKAELGNKQ